MAASRNGGLDQRQRADDIVAPVQARFFATFADLGQSGKVQHGGRLVPGKHLIQLGAVCQIALFKRAEFDRILPAGRQVIISNGGVAARLESLAGVRADITGASGDKNSFQSKSAQLLLCGVGYGYHFAQVIGKFTAQLVARQPEGNSSLQKPGY